MRDIKLSEKDLEITHGYTYEQLFDMYVTENYSMELVSRVISVELPILSRIFRKYGLTHEKEKVNPKFIHEVTHISKNSNVSPKIKKNVEDSFWDEIM